MSAPVASMSNRPTDASAAKTARSWFMSASGHIICVAAIWPTLTPSPPMVRLVA